MSSTGSREEMLETLRKAKEAMARRAAAVPTSNNSNININYLNNSSEGALVFSTTTTTKEEEEELTKPPRHHIPSEAKDNRSHFFQTWCRKIEMFLADPTKTALELPKELAPNDRRELHMLAEKYNLSHHSRGTGPTRQLILKKDALHYRMPEARPETSELLKQLQQESTNSNNNNNNNNNEKQSKYHLRRVRGINLEFGDEETANMVKRLTKATDEYRRATEIGYTQEELLQIESGETVEEILSRADETNNTNNNNNNNINNNSLYGGSSYSTTTAIDAVRINNNNNNNNNNQTTFGKKSSLYDEVCLRCGARARVDYDVQKWECNGYCAQCTMQTIWKLVQVEENNNNNNNNITEELVETSLSPNRKRSRQEMIINSISGASPQPPQPEEIDKDNDEDDTITVEDVVDMASMNDFCAADVNWIRRFATYHQSKDSTNILSKFIVFCIEFNDLFSMRIFREFLTPKLNSDSSENVVKRVRDESEINTSIINSSNEVKNHYNNNVWFIHLREVKEASVPLSVLLEELCAFVPEKYDRIAVAFPNMSVYGVAASCVCLIRPGESLLLESNLESLQKKYGRHNVRFSRELAAVLLQNNEKTP